MQYTDYDRSYIDHEDNLKPNLQQVYFNSSIFWRAKTHVFLTTKGSSPVLGDIYICRFFSTWFDMHDNNVESRGGLANSWTPYAP